MLRVELSSAAPGMTLALPVRHPKAPQQTLLKVGYSLEADSIKRLTSMGVRSVWIRYPGLELLDKYVDPKVVAAQSELLGDVADGFEKAGRQAAAKLNFDQYARSIGKLVSSLVNNPQAAIFLGALEGEGGCLMRHSSTVAFLSVLMGLKLEGYLVQQRRHIDPARAKECTNLGVGAIVHDIGMLQLDPEVRKRYEETGDDSDPAFRKHTTLGYQLVRGNIDPTAATIVVNHHQRYDGSGYGGEQVAVLEGERIHVFSRIVALADYFDDMQNPVTGGGPLPTVKVLRHLLEKEVSARFDPRVLQTLFAVVPAYPPGSILTLNDERRATAVDNNPIEPCRPTIQIIDMYRAADERREPETLDLTQHRNVTIVACDGVDVRDDNFDLPATMRTDQLAAWWSRASA